MKKIIEFKDFSFKYNSQKDCTLKNINLTIYEGEKVLIIGESGSGKSTLFNAINGLVPFFFGGEIKGSLKINGKETKDMSIFEISKSVGTILQDTDNQFISLTSAEDIAFKLENLCIDYDTMHRQVSKISKLIHIENLLNSSPHNLSGGQKQKVTLAGAIIDGVNILLFDEPLASLDPKNSIEIINLMNSLTENTKKTLIVIEHRLEEMLKIKPDRVVLIDNGCIVFNGKMKELLYSGLLNKCGIREPLYLTALKYLNTKITEDLDLENIENLNSPSIIENLKKFYGNENDEISNINSKDVILKCNNINFSYNKSNPILKNVSFDIYENEITCIVGKNGAGKSTISKVICGFVKNNSGNILFNNTDITNYSIYERSKMIGYVMQNPNHMISNSIVFDEVAFTLKNLHIEEDEIKQRVNEILKVCNLYEIRNWPISALSFGQKRRVTIASILVMNPKVLILDEPTAGQDFRTYNKIMKFIKNLTKQNITPIIITHNMYLLLEYADKCLVISDGENIGYDTPCRILSNENIIKEANLSQTSIHELCKICRIPNTENFINKFIKYDRSKNKWTSCLIIPIETHLFTT